MLRARLGPGFPLQRLAQPLPAVPGAFNVAVAFAPSIVTSKAQPFLLVF